MESEINELLFQLNNEVFTFDSKCIDVNDVKSIKEDDRYAVKYIKNLIKNGSISLQDPLQTIYKILNNKRIAIYDIDKEESSHLQSELEQVEADFGTVGDNNYYTMKPESKALLFQINNEVFTFDTRCMDVNDVKSIKEDDRYAVKYIINLIKNGSISLQDPLQTIYKMLNNQRIAIYDIDEGESSQLESELEQVDEDFGTVGDKKRSEWGEEDTQQLLEKYEIYMKLVGPMKKFKNKKAMWKKIAQDIEDNMNRKYTSIQVENRFKTLLKRKKDAISHNKCSGNERMDVPYEEQLEKIASADDSIKPEILMSINNTRILKSFQLSSSPKAVKMIPEKKIVKPALKRNIETETKENKKKSIQETLLELHQLKEENKERRHKEKLQLIRELYKKDT